MTGSIGDKIVWQLYERASEEERYFLAEMHRKLVFFGSLLPALFGATIAGVLASTAAWHYLILSVGPMVIYKLAETATDTMCRSHRRVLEAIALRAKAEYDLGLTKARSGDESKMWYAREAFIAPRHLKGRHSLYKMESVRDDFVIPFFPVAGAKQIRISIERVSGTELNIDGSDEFVLQNLATGVNATYSRLFGSVQLLSVLAIVFLIGVAIVTPW